MFPRMPDTDMPNIGWFSVKQVGNGLQGHAVASEASDLSDIVFCELRKMRRFALMRWLPVQFTPRVLLVLFGVDVFKVCQRVVRPVSVLVIDLKVRRANECRQDKPMDQKASMVCAGPAECDSMVAFSEIRLQCAAMALNLSVIADFVERFVALYWHPSLRHEPVYNITLATTGTR